MQGREVAGRLKRLWGKAFLQDRDADAQVVDSAGGQPSGADDVAAFPGKVAREEGRAGADFPARGATAALHALEVFGGKLSSYGVESPGAFAAGPRLMSQWRR